MGLGLYQVMTTQAKRAGGVDPWLKGIGEKAVAKARPAIFREGFERGLGTGVAATLVVGGAAVAAWHRWDGTKAREALPDAAKPKPEVDIEPPVLPHDADPEIDKSEG